MVQKVDNWQANSGFNDSQRDMFSSTKRLFRSWTMPLIALHDYGDKTYSPRTTKAKEKEGKGVKECPCTFDWHPKEQYSKKQELYWLSRGLKLSFKYQSLKTD